MIRATAISVVDQALLSALSFLLALVLIRFGSQQEYGLYTQLMGLQSLFSVLHAGLFVSAYLSMLPRLEGAARHTYQAGMARAELGVTVLLAVVVAGLTWLVAEWLGHPLAFATSVAAALALLGLWWREFTRARYFVEGRALHVLRVDVAYAVLVASGLVWMILARTTAAATVLWCIGCAGMVVAVLPIIRQSRAAAVDRQAIQRSLKNSWQPARWEVLTSLVTWGHAQSFVYFAALQGGLAAAAEVSAARLLVMPLALVWLSYANILRPEASRLLEQHDGHARLNHLAWRSALFVLALALTYGLFIVAAMPLLEKHLFGGQFQHMAPLTLLWLAYFALTGMTTIATSLLRSAFEFKALFRIHLFCAVIAVFAFCAGLGAHTPAVFIVALVAVEAVLAFVCWRRLRGRLRGAPQLGLSGARGV